MVYAEVIGDPIAQSKSPIIHHHWLDRLGIDGEYVRTRVVPGDLTTFLDGRRSDPDWRGCNVTIPHKESILPLLDRLDPGAAAIGAINCVVPEDGRLTGYNTDIEGVAAALDSAELCGRTTAVIGAGGGARAMVAYLAGRGVGRIVILARNPGRAQPLRALVAGVRVDILPVDQAGCAFTGAAAIVNASPLGMAGASPMPPAILEAVRSHAARATVFDLVTTPAETEFLAAGRAGGGQAVDGLSMLAGQAARAFYLFFGSLAPEPDAALRNLLAGGDSLFREAQ